MAFFDFIKNLFTGKKDNTNKNSTSAENPKLLEAVKSLVKNQITLVPGTTDKVKHPYSSKIGGKPYLPSHFVWPTYTSYDDGVERPLSFFCQIDIGDIKHLDKDGLLPCRGMLYFFYECESSVWGFDPKDDGAARVFWHDTTDELSMISFDIPTSIAQEFVIPEIPLKFKMEKSYPYFEEFEFFSDVESDFDEYDEVLAKLGVDIDADEYAHKLLGYADIIQNEMLTECERTSRGLYCGDSESYQNTPHDVEADINKHASDWVLLLQLSTIEKDDFEFMFGDCGILYFYIKKEDLAAMRFDKVRFCLQCG